ncbi:phosphodiester glycosidase family protein [Anaerosacchariphilus polymeriproducens]|uniref:Phosphodiester glycosidase family protein n=1 Tax=Anaerosacchariphilus polymeriproducens TaxID=1812858 RepID=A0A371AY57_9FIRM|nr:phosphodiester glycosidase family protein [Anaerosacchariphilus polymeriproducens]RDU24501.1 phosphodiester glycosidase family protein [Anaerosacchariphilus polymeriproducens]
MKQKKKLLPVWLIIVIDLLIIAAYTGGFYAFYYLTPRQLESSGIKTTQESSSSSTENNTGALTDSTDSSKTTNTTTSENWAEKFADKFTDTVVTTDSSYSSSNISITVNKCTQGSGNNIVTYYVADVYLASIDNLQTGFADDTYGVGYTDDVLGMDEEFNALLAMNGDYYGNGSNGVVVRNGEVYRETTNDSDVCVLYYDGTMKTYSSDEFDVEQAIADGAYQAWSFGPELLDESGNSKTSFNADGHVSQTNPRSAIGYYEPGHYCFVVVDGRQSGYSIGLDLLDFSQLFEELGCTAAYNLDGGKSSEMSFNDTFVNQPADGGREISDCIIIKEVE